MIDKLYRVCVSLRTISCNIASILQTGDEDGDMATISRIEESRDDKEDWNQYAERLEHFFTANGITSDEKKQAVFLTIIGAKAYKQLRSLIAPAKPGEKDFTVLAEAMKNHYTPAPSGIVQRFRFNSCFRRPGESVST